MTLVKRFTPGGNLYPDGSSTFAVLRDVFEELAKNRDARDSAINSAWKQSDDTVRDAAFSHAAGVAVTAENNAKVHAAGAAQSAELNAKTHADAAATTAKTDANAYTDASFAATAAGGATDAAVDAAVNRATLAGRIVPDSIISGLIGNLTSATRTAVQGMVREAAGIVVRDLGTTDDAPALTSALGSSFTRLVTIPAGATANLATTVTIPANKTLIVEAGATVKRVGTGTAQVLQVAAGATLTGGGTVDAATLSTSAISVIGAGATIRGVTIVNANLYGIHNSGRAELRVEGCRFSGNGSYALLAENTAAVRVVFSANIITSGGRGVMYKDAREGVIANNIISLTAGVAIEVFGANATRVTVTGNTILGTPIIGVSLAAAAYCTVSGNSVTGCTQIGLENAEGASYNTFTGNTVNNGTGDGVQLTSGANGAKPIHDVTISGNTITGMGGRGIATEYGYNASITNNTVSACGSTGIYTNNNSVAYIIAGNIVTPSEATSGSGIRVAGTECMVDGNTVDCTQRTTQTGFIDFAVVGGSRNTFQNNFVRGGGTGFAVNNSVRTVLNNNRTVGTVTASVHFYGANNTAMLLTHISALASGVVVKNDNAVPVTGPLINAT